MSIVLKDGTVLPDIPREYTGDKDLTNAPPYESLVYHTIFKHYGDVGNHYPYVLWCVEKPITLYSNDGDKNLMAMDVDNLEDMSANFALWVLHDDGTWYLYKVSDASSPGTMMWQLNGTDAGEDIWLSYEYTVETNIVWSDYDIMSGTAQIDYENETVSFVPDSEPYFPNSVSKPPFILPDGTEIPAFPDGWSDGTPYGALIFWDLRSDYSTQFMCALYASDKPLLSLPDELLPDPSASISPGNPLLCVQPGFCEAFQYIGPDGAWSGAEKGEGTELAPSMPTMMVVWSNHDILNITSLNEDDMSYTIGTEIAYKSDENYRITGGYMTSIANEARRLGGMSGELTPAAMETALRGVE